jgi:guanylate kinase
MARVVRKRNGRTKQKKIARRGLMFVLSSPSGAGKTTLSRKLLESDPRLELSISVTTRPKRDSEVGGRDYHFIDDRRFVSMVRNGELLEWAEVFGFRYGTPQRPVEKALRAGRDILFDIDWQGAQQLREKARDDLVTVFILPPSADELERRLHTRAQDSREVIDQRMAMATREMSHWPEYDYVVVNRNIELAFAELQTILMAERLRRDRQIGLSDFVRVLIEPSRERRRPSQGRRHSISPEDRRRSREDAAALHKQMLQRIGALELVIAQLPATAGVGHNNPPDPIALPPLESSDVNRIKRDISFLGKQPVTPPQSTDEVRAAANRLRIFAERIYAYLAKQADNFVSSAVKSAGKAVPIWTLFGDQLIGLSNAVARWLSALPHF